MELPHILAQSVSHAQLAPCLPSVPPGRLACVRFRPDPLAESDLGAIAPAASSLPEPEVASALDAQQSTQGAAQPQFASTWSSPPTLVVLEPHGVCRFEEPRSVEPISEPESAWA